MKRPHIKNTKYLNKELSTDDNILLNKLKSLRLDIAKQRRLPAYTVFHDSTLIQMSQTKPTNEIDMLENLGKGQQCLVSSGQDYTKITRLK